MAFRLALAGGEKNISKPAQDVNFVLATEAKINLNNLVTLESGENLEKTATHA
jgi:hypothetical protein